MVNMSTTLAGLNDATAAVLRGERAAAVMTIEELSERSGIPKVSVQRFLAGRRAINLDVLDALCGGLGLAPEQVIVQARLRRGQGDPELVGRIVSGVTSVTRPESPENVTDRTESS